jgi:hypothetical protein
VAFGGSLLYHVLMRVTFVHGVRLGLLSFDPTARAPIALWTHRPRRRPPARVVLASAPLAAQWSGVQGLPIGRSAVAGGRKIELLPTGYGLGGSAALLTDAGHRVLVVGPTTESLAPRHVEQLVLRVPSVTPPPSDWMARVIDAGETRIVAPDGAGLTAVCAALDAAGVAHRRPPWMPGGTRSAPLLVTMHGSGFKVDLRPQAPAEWLVDFALACAPEQVHVHGAEAEVRVSELTAAGLTARVIHAPSQLVLTSLSAHDARVWPITMGPGPRPAPPVPPEE